ncbi:MAG: helix-turn-helix transcriptional regulator [Lachnospiraceae bacterium]|nr:helix-turn-helix transcriptional regulator [Lachnospiraceae bacterium]
MAIDFKLIGSRIKQQRKVRGKTQEDLAADIYVSAGYISQIERGITKVNLETLSDIADFLECDIADFISMSNLRSNDSLKDKFSTVYNKLSIEEREMLYQLLLTYTAKRSS